MTDSNREGDSTDPGLSGLWVPVAELAQMRGLARQVMYRKVDRLVEQGALTIRTGSRGIKLVSPAEYDRAVGMLADLAREQGALTRGGEDAEADQPSDGATATYTREQARRQSYLADITRLDLEERLGELVKVAELRPLLVAAGEAVAGAIDNLSHDADLLRKAAQGEDETVFDRALRDAARRVRAKALAAIQAAMPSRRAARGTGAEGAGIG